MKQCEDSRYNYKSIQLNFSLMKIAREKRQYTIWNKPFQIQHTKTGTFICITLTIVLFLSSLFSPQIFPFCLDLFLTEILTNFPVRTGIGSVPPGKQEMCEQAGFSLGIVALVSISKTSRNPSGISGKRCIGNGLVIC